MKAGRCTHAGIGGDSRHQPEFHTLLWEHHEGSLVQPGGGGMNAHVVWAL